MEHKIPPPQYLKTSNHPSYFLCLPYYKYYVYSIISSSSPTTLHYNEDRYIYLYKIGIYTYIR